MTSCFVGVMTNAGGCGIIRGLCIGRPAMTLNKSDLQRHIAAMPNTTHAVLGDMVIDEMIYGNVDRLSREAPVIILRHQNTDIVMGGGANAVHNVAAYNATAHALGVWGDDYYAPRLDAVMKDAGIQTDHMVVDASRPTTTKTRISGVISSSITQQMLRLDRECREPLSQPHQDTLLTHLESLLPTCNGLLLSDYRLGVVTSDLATKAIALGKKHNAIIAVDSQQELRNFKGASIITPNQDEAEKNVGFALDSREAVIRAGKMLLNETGIENVLITLGQDGMALFEGNTNQVHFIPVFNKSEVFDVTGAGDTVVGTWLVARAAGASVLEAAVLGNLAASLVVRVFGSAVTSCETLAESVHALPLELLTAIETIGLN
jgi:D-glycero-beta-D-manno-heptose-7-phosphate kinase